MKKLILKSSVLILALSLTIVACKKDQKEEPAQDKDTSASTDNSDAENTANDIVLIGNQALDNTNNTLSTFRNGQPLDEPFLTTCASSIVVDTTLKLVTVTFDGSVVCTDGRTRSGSLTFDYSQSTNGAKHYRTPGFKCAVTASNYKVDGNAITINSKSIQNTTAVGFNPQTTNITWTIISNISITKTDGTIVTWNCTRYKTLLNTSDVNVYVNDNAPIVWTKARIGLTGSASGVTAQGNTYTANITSQLVRDFNCSPSTSYPHRHPFIQGVIELTPQGKLTRKIDYGTGTCDLNATVTVGTYTAAITLH